jgi:hypothetical protein
VNLLALVTVELSVFVIVMLYRPVVAPAGMTRIPVICVGDTTLTFVRDIDVGAWGDYNIPEARDIPDKIEPDRMAGTIFTIVVKEKT